jgi:hypothetical protein
MAQLTPKQTQDLLNALRLKYEPDVAAAFIDAIGKMATGIPFQRLVDLIDQGRVSEAVALVEQLRALFFPLDDTLRSVFIQGGLFTMENLPALRSLNGTRFLIGFNGRHVRAEAWARDRVGTLITSIEQEQVELIRNVIVDGLKVGRNSAAVARDLVGTKNPVTGMREGGIIGLSSPQTDTLINSRYDLYSGDPKRLERYLSRESRNKTYDAMVKRAIRGETRLTSAQIEEILKAQKSKMLRQRGETIARNETYTALSAGQHEGWQQVIDAGAVKASDVTKRWQHNLNNPFRPDHVALSGTTIAFDQKFSVGGAQMAHDHDPAGGAKNNINCHCTTFYRLRKGRALDG